MRSFFVVSLLVGGIRQSGTGTEGGRHSLEFYSNIKNVCLHNGPDPTQ
jgi:acyl-CoA reductase-like NAD-dependent aldehyde dehydrogenase